MSFSRSLSGSATAVAVTLLSLASEQRATDEKYGAAPGVVLGHERQIVAIGEAVKPLLDALPESAHLSGSCWGHANESQEGSWGYSLTISSVSGGGTTAAVPSGSA